MSLEATPSLPLDPESAEKLAQAEVKFAVNEAMPIINNSIVERFPFLSQLELQEQLHNVDASLNALACVIQKHLISQGIAADVNLSEVLRSILMRVSNCKDKSFDNDEAEDLLRNLNVSTGLIKTIEGETTSQVSFMSNLQSRIKNLQTTLSEIDTNNIKAKSQREFNAPAMKIDSEAPPKVSDSKRFSTTLEVEPQPIVDGIVQEGTKENNLSEIITDEFEQKKDEVINIITEFNQANKSKEEDNN